MEPPTPHDEEIERLTMRHRQASHGYDFEPLVQELRERAQSIEDEYTVLRRQLQPGDR